VENNDTTDAAKRQQRLQALRNKQKEQPANPASKNVGPFGPLKTGQDTVDDDKTERRRTFVKKLLKNRMQEGLGEGGNGQGKTAKNKGLLRNALDKQAKKSGESFGKGLDNFPGLKAIIERRSGQAKSEPSADVEELKARATKLEKALKRTLEQLEKSKEPQIKKQQDSSAENDKG
jgi:hypothetical protein